MQVGVMTAQIYMQGIGSLKDKRHIVKSVIGRLQSRFNVSIAEVDLQDNRNTAAPFLIATAFSRHPRTRSTDVSIRRNPSLQVPEQLQLSPQRPLGG